MLERIADVQLEIGARQLFVPMLEGIRGSRLLERRLLDAVERFFGLILREPRLIHGQAEASLEEAVTAAACITRRFGEAAPELDELTAQAQREQAIRAAHRLLVIR